jgi:cytochrome P450
VRLETDDSTQSLGDTPGVLTRLLHKMNRDRGALPPSLPLWRPLQTLLWLRRPTEFMHFWSRHYGSAYRLRMMPFGLCLFSDPESIRTIFASKPDEMHAGKVNRILRALVGDSSVLLLDGSDHMRQRKLLLPSFHGERMRLYGETMASIARTSIARWPSDRVFSLHAQTQEITLQIILRTVFGADEGAELTALRRQIKRLLALAEYRLTFVLMIFLAPRPELDARPLWRFLLRHRTRTDALLYRTIAARRADPQARERKDVLAMLMQARDEAGEPMSDRELRDELMTALVAGHETTATALAWAFERILSHPEVYARLNAEVQAAGGCSATPEKIVALPYLDATIKEVLRLRPIIPVVGRMLQKPTRIGGYDLPVGTAVGACIYLAQRNPDVYPEPDAFRPERFLDQPTDPVSWLPFGGGIRRCIGAQFATYEMKIVLATMLAHGEYALAQATPARITRRAITFFPERGTRIRLLRRSA